MTQTQQVHIRHDYTIDVPAYGQHMDIDRLIDIVQRSGSHFFDADTKRFFRSRVDYVVRPCLDPAGWFFITSEKHVSHTSYVYFSEPRRYTVRFLRLTDYDGKSGVCLLELENFQRYASLKSARRAMDKARVDGATHVCGDCSTRLTFNSSNRCDECQQRKDKYDAAERRRQENANDVG